MAADEDRRLAETVKGELPEPPEGVVERRADQEFLHKLLEQLGTMEGRYIRFAGRQMIALAIVAVLVFASLGLGALTVRQAHEAARDADDSAARAELATAQQGELIERLDEVAVEAQRIGAERDAAQCREIEALKRLIRGAVEDLIDDPAIERRELLRFEPVKCAAIEAERPVRPR